MENGLFVLGGVMGGLMGGVMGGVMRGVINESFSFQQAAVCAQAIIVAQLYGIELMTDLYWVMKYQH